MFYTLIKWCNTYSLVAFLFRIRANENINKKSKCSIVYLSVKLFLATFEIN